MEMYKKIADLYDLLYEDLNDSKFWNNLCHKYGGPVLELGCGTGRIMLGLAKAGFDVAGIDKSKELLAVLKKKALKDGMNPQIKEADMRSFSVDRMFRTVIIPFSSFQHLLNTKDQEACLKTVKKHLLQEGNLIIDVFNPDESRPENIMCHQKTIKDSSGRIISKFHTQTFNKTLQHTNSIFFIDITEKTGTLKRITTDFTLKYHFYRDLKKLLESCGFRVVETYGDYSQTRFSEKDSPRMIVVARRTD